MYRLGSNSWISAAIGQGLPAGSNLVSGPTALFPSRMAFQNVVRSFPFGAMMPMPVMTTRRRAGSRKVEGYCDMRRLPWRPLEGPSRKEMNVKMRHGFPGIAPVVDDDPVTALQYAQ